MNNNGDLIYLLHMKEIGVILGALTEKGEILSRTEDNLLAHHTSRERSEYLPWRYYPEIEQLAWWENATNDDIDKIKHYLQSKYGYKVSRVNHLGRKPFKENMNEGARMDEIDREITKLKALHKHISDINPLEPRLHNITQKIDKLQKERKNWEMLWSAVNEGIDAPPIQQSVSSISTDFIKYIKTAEIGSSGPLQPKYLKVYNVAGIPHIGYGHKVKPNEVNLFNNGITQKQADDILLRDLEFSKKNMSSEVKSLFHVSIPLDKKQEEMLIDFEFNLGTIRSFPKFVRAVLNKDWKIASREYKRSYTNERGVKKELGRNQLFYNRYFSQPAPIKENISEMIRGLITEGLREKAMEDFLAKIIRGTEWDGKVFIAGGYVRDEYMGKDPKDLILEMEGYDPEMALRGKVKRLELELKVEYPQIADLSLFLRSGGEELHLNSIRMKPNEKGKGIGRKVMDRIIEFADQNKLYITLKPAPEKGYKEKLLQFYKSFGFYPNRGNRALSQFGGAFGVYWIRRPKSSLKETINEETIKVVVGIIDPQDQIKSELTLYAGDKGSHASFNYNYGLKWRYNPKTKIVYWSGLNRGQQTADDIINVENHLYKKYGFYVDDNIDLFDEEHFGLKNINLAHGIMDNK